MNKGKIIIAIITFMLIMSWIAFDIYHAQGEATTINPKLQEALESIDPVFDKQTLQEIESKVRPVGSTVSESIPNATISGQVDSSTSSANISQ